MQDSSIRLSSGAWASYWIKLRLLSCSHEPSWHEYFQTGTWNAWTVTCDINYTTFKKMCTLLVQSDLYRQMKQVWKESKATCGRSCLDKVCMLRLLNYLELHGTVHDEQVYLTSWPMGVFIGLGNVFILFKISANTITIQKTILFNTSDTEI